MDQKEEDGTDGSVPTRLPSLGTPYKSIQDLETFSKSNKNLSKQPLPPVPVREAATLEKKDPASGTTLSVPPRVSKVGERPGPSKPLKPFSADELRSFQPEHCLDKADFNLPPEVDNAPYLDGEEYRSASGRSHPTRSSSLESLVDRAYGLKTPIFAVRALWHYSPGYDKALPKDSQGLVFYSQDILHIYGVYDDDWWIGVNVTTLLEPNSPGKVFGLIPTWKRVRNMEAYFASTKAAKLNMEDNVRHPNYSLAVAKDKNRVRSRAQRALFSPLQMLFTPFKVLVRKAVPRRLADYPPYEKVPLMRPLILLGPSSKAFDLTFFMHKAILSKLEKDFMERIEVVDRDQIVDEQGKMVEGAEQQLFALGNERRLLILDLEIDDIPLLLDRKFSALFVYFKIASFELLEKVIKTLGSSGNPGRKTVSRKEMSIQLEAMEHLSTYERDLDVVITESDLDKAYLLIKRIIDSQL
eukprot:Colp12_sorted_trinity150504_noHs@2405